MNGYLYDPHTHTSEASRCGKMAAADIVDLYVKNGFTGIVVTDHLHPEYLQRIDKNHNWDEVMDHFLSGYHASKKRGDEVGLDVILGAELRFPENDNDYLVYGIDEQWLRANPYICCMHAQEFFDKYHDEVLIIHAHPFRENSAPVQETAVHGAEAVNSNPRHDNSNLQALHLCQRHPEWYRTAGSDTHRPGDEACAGIILPERVQDSVAFKGAIESRNFYLWCPQFQDVVDRDTEMRNKGR